MRLEGLSQASVTSGQKPTGSHLCSSPPPPPCPPSPKSEPLVTMAPIATKGTGGGGGGGGEQRRGPAAWCSLTAHLLKSKAGGRGTGLPP